MPGRLILCGRNLTLGQCCPQHPVGAMFPALPRQGPGIHLPHPTSAPLHLLQRNGQGTVMGAEVSTHMPVPITRPLPGNVNRLFKWPKLPNEGPLCSMPTPGGTRECLSDPFPRDDPRSIENMIKSPGMPNPVAPLPAGQADIPRKI